MSRTFTDTPEPRYVERAKHIDGMEGLSLNDIENFEDFLKVIPTEIVVKDGRLYLAHDTVILTGQDGLPLAELIEKVEITNVPNTATQGTLTEAQLTTLQNDAAAYIMFNHEKFYLMDEGHTEDFLTYSHVGVDSDIIHIKTITITINTRGWVMTDVAITE